MSAAAPARAPSVSWNGHAGPVVGHANGMDILSCARCGFRHAVPLPSPAQLAREYAENYYADAKPTYLADADADQRWARLFQVDRLDAIARALGRSAGTLVEIGSGPGFFLETAAARGFTAIGVEPSRQAAAFAQGRGLTVHNRTFADALAHGLPRADVIAATNVLEHIPDPIDMLAAARDQMDPGKDSQAEKDQKTPLYSISTRCDKDNRTRCQYQAAGFVAHDLCHRYAVE